jgi:hypothetical protein
MKLLLVSMPSIHVIRWIENLKDADIELYWFDVLGKGKLETDVQLTQITDWKKRKLPYIKGEHYLSKNFPNVYRKMQPFLEVTSSEAFRNCILQNQPDIVHSFEMQSCSYPLLDTIKDFPNIKWIYSCWGSDLYYYSKIAFHKTKIKSILNRVDYLITDCNRDFEIAKREGFRGDFLGVIPGGTGFKIKELKDRYSVKHRKVILIKGYEHQFGRGLNVVKAIHKLESEIQDLKVVVFGTHPIVIDYIKENSLPYIVYDRHGLSHSELLKIMGKTLIYVGNSISDGMPNTLLESIVMGAFPIQSNPGNVTAEIIDNQKNGLLISNPEDINEIKNLISFAINNKVMIDNAITINQIITKERLDFFDNQQKILNLYKKLEN